MKKSFLYPLVLIVVLMLITCVTCVACYDLTVYPDYSAVVAILGAVWLVLAFLIGEHIHVILKRSKFYEDCLDEMMDHK